MFGVGEKEQVDDQAFFTVIHWTDAMLHLVSLKEQKCIVHLFTVKGHDLAIHLKLQFGRIIASLFEEWKCLLSADLSRCFRRSASHTVPGLRVVKKTNLVAVLGRDVVKVVSSARTLVRNASLISPSTTPAHVPSRSSCRPSAALERLNPLLREEKTDGCLEPVAVFPLEGLIWKKVLDGENALVTGLIVEDARFGSTTKECRLE